MRFLYFSLIALFSITVNVKAQKTVRLDATKANNYGVAYSLPKSALEVTIEYTKKTKAAGAYYMYAERYLNIPDPIIENSVEYELTGINSVVTGIPDKSNSFLVEFKSNSAMAFVTLTPDGMICAINSDYAFPAEEETKEKQANTKKIDGRQYFTEEILRTGSSAKQAELIAKQIYRLRESRNDILTGEADNMPPDGDSYKLVMQQLDEQEMALTNLFVGEEVRETMKKVIKIEIGSRNIQDEVIARFSKKLGVVEANNLAGEPINMTLKSKLAIPNTSNLTPKEIKDRESKFSKGIVYNIPGKANIQVSYKNKVYVSEECDIVQFGLQDVLDNSLFGDKTSPLKVIFYPHLGAIKETGSAK